MKSSANFVTLFLLQSFLFPPYSSCLHQNSSDDSSPFPSDFLFGTSSSAYQVLPFSSFHNSNFFSCLYPFVMFFSGCIQYEGAYLTDGKGLNNWDVFSHENPGMHVFIWIRFAFVQSE